MARQHLITIEDDGVVREKQEGLALFLSILRFLYTLLIHLSYD